MITYIIWEVSPEIFEGFTFLRWYGVCWVIGMFFGYLIMRKIYRSEQRPLEELDELTMYIMVGGVVGARLGHILFYDPIYYFNNPIEILPIKIDPAFEFTGLAGLASHGGALGALLALYLYKRKFRTRFLWLLDRLIIAGAALGGMIRVGNLLNSEIIGTPSDVPWAFVFTSVDYIPRHPAQLYEALFYLGVTLVLYVLWKSKKFYKNDGFISGLGVTLIFAQRFFIEFLKENQVGFEETLFLNMGQLLSIPFIIGGVTLVFPRFRDSLKGLKGTKGNK